MYFSITHKCLLLSVPISFICNAIARKRRVRVTTLTTLPVFEYSIHHISGVSVTIIMTWVSKCLERNIVLGYIRPIHDFKVKRFAKSIMMRGDALP